jgi:3-ketoacyl-CoA synthase
MLLTNVLFRMGGAAVLLSNSRANARFELMQIVRKSTSAHDYHCVFKEEDQVMRRLTLIIQPRRLYTMH